MCIWKSNMSTTILKPFQTSTWAIHTNIISIQLLYFSVTNFCLVLYIVCMFLYEREALHIITLQFPSLIYWSFCNLGSIHLKPELDICISLLHCFYHPTSLLHLIWKQRKWMSIFLFFLFFCTFFLCFVLVYKWKRNFLII